MWKHRALPRDWMELPGSEQTVLDVYSQGKPEDLTSLKAIIEEIIGVRELKANRHSTDLDDIQVELD